MASVVLDFQIVFYGDGVTTAFTADLKSAPFGFTNFGTLSAQFDPSKPAPTSVISSSPSTYSMSLAGTVLTVTFVSAPGVGSIGASGILLY